MKQRLSRLVRKPLVVYLIVAVSVLGPMLLPGFILALDMVFTPELRLPAQVNNLYLFFAILHWLNALVPSDWLQKIILLTILVGSGVGMHRLVAGLLPKDAQVAEYWPWATYIAGFFYMVNPFTYARFMAGQYLVLLGYALLPVIMLAAKKFFSQPTLRHAIWLGGWVALMGLVSIHSVGLALVIIGAAGGAFGWSRWRKGKYWQQTVLGGGLIVGMCALINGYWLLPLIRGEGTTAQTINHFDQVHFRAFATVGENTLDQIIHVLRLQGFWAEGRDLFLSPQDLMPLWGIVMMAVWALVIIGAITLWRQHRQLAVCTGILFFVGIMIGAGVGLEWLSAHLPFFAGYREPHKFVALVALAYAVTLPFGMVKVWQWTAQRQASMVQFAIVGGLLLPVLLTSTMFWGFSGQLEPRHYPADWSATNNQLNQDQDRFKVVFLPWHQYMSFQFANRIIMNPGEKFFDKPTLISNNPEIDNVPATVPDATKAAIQVILKNAPQRQDLGARLAAHGVKYIVLAEEYDFEKYAYLASQPDLQLVTDLPSIKLYRNQAWHK